MEFEVDQLCKFVQQRGAGREALRRDDRLAERIAANLFRLYAAARGVDVGEGYGE